MCYHIRDFIDIRSLLIYFYKNDCSLDGTYLVSGPEAPLSPVK